MVLENACYIPNYSAKSTKIILHRTACQAIPKDLNDSGGVDKVDWSLYGDKEVDFSSYSTSPEEEISRETSAPLSPYGGKSTLSTQLTIKSVFHSPTDATPQAFHSPLVLSKSTAEL